MTAQDANKMAPPIIERLDALAAIYVVAREALGGNDE